jgi:transcriptional regulator with XRE-family HTH domain
MPSDSSAFFELCRQALGTTQKELGRQIGISRRTAQRWASSGTPAWYLPELARAVHPADPALAQEIAAAAGTTLEALGVIAPPPPPPPPAPPAPHPSIVDAVVCAAAEAMDLPPREVRPGLYAAIVRARELGLALDKIEQALAVSLKTPRKTAATPRRG